MVKRSMLKSEEMSQQPVPSTASSNQSGSNDFVKKLFQMLQEDSYKDIVRWTTNGDSFVVINTNEFTKEILPRHFKHSNFASFVRQLNKYDFHKVKIPNEEKQFYQYGEDAWEFKHPDFKINDRESLENIKRKGPTTKKNMPGALSTGNFLSYSDSQAVQHMKDEIDFLTQENKSLHQDISILQTKYKTLIDNIVALKSFDERYYRSINVLINCLIQAGIKLPPLDFPNPALVSVQAPPSVPTHHAPSQVHTNTSMQQMPSTMLSPNGSNNHHANVNSQGVHQFDPNFVQQHQPYPRGQIHPANPTQNATVPTPPAANENSNSKPHSPQQLNNSTSQSPLLVNSGLNVANATVTKNMHSRTSSSSNPNPAGPQLTDTTQHQNAPQVTTTNIPNPKFRVLLVEDDNVCIQLCRKFLVKYGCQVTVVTDGLDAISTVEHTKYDLVLMDIVMPNLDGATATSVIRSFDTKTPIIAMTGNIEDNDLVTYLQNGMSDILAKPFTKDDLYSILSKHLLTIQDRANSGPAEDDITSLQGPPQQSLTLPQDAQQQTSVRTANEPLMKKQRMNQ